MTTFTHRKKIYRARCVQWTPDSTEEVLRVLGEHSDASEYGGSIMIRWNNPTSHKYHIQMFHPTMWVRIGENGEMRLITNAEFELKYEPI